MRLDIFATIPLTAALAAAACGPTQKAGGVTPAHTPAPAAPTVKLDPREGHLANARQLTFGGENAEAYWSSDGTELILQSTHGELGCDQIFRISAVDPNPTMTMVSTGKGRTTCSYFFPGDQRILYASTHAASEACPPPADMSKGYVWPLYDSYDIYSAKPDGSDLVPLTKEKGYDAEATVCPRDGSIIFTSTRDGDIELYRMNADGSGVVRLTHTPGYDGGAFFNHDCTQIVWRASRPQPGKEEGEFKALLAQGLVKPGKLELYVANADGSEARQVTYLDAATFAPYFFPSGDRIIFSSNYGDPKGREFEIWAINVDGTGLERITYSEGFDGFPMFSPDGKRLAFASNRQQGKPGETNVFVADWVDAPAATAAAAALPAGVAGAGSPLAADRVMTDVRWLADDARQGRGVGTAGLDASADYLAKGLETIGVQPGVPGWKASFEVPVGVKAGEATTVVVDGAAVKAEAFVPMGFSASGDVTAQVVVAGWGVTAPELKHDDYKGLNVKGKVVVVRRFVPDGTKFEDDKAQRQYGDLRYKAWNAREHGAVAVIVVDAPAAAAGGKGAGGKGAGGKGAKADAKEPPAEAPLPRLAVDTMGDAGLPVVVVTRAAGAALLDKKPHTARVAVALTVEKKPVYNIVGKIESGAAKKLPGVIVIGAHYDHLGLGGPGSLAPDVHEAHNGADDNASGTAALLEVARELVARRGELQRDVWIVAFSAEEMGVLGSNFLTRTPPAGLAMKDVVAMLNMDMVGRLRENRVAVLGGESADEWAALVQPVCQARKLECTIGGSGYGPSDHMPFYAAGVPVLHFFSGAHADYHKPSDDAAKINAAGIARVALVVADTAIAVAGRDARLTFKAAPPQLPMGDRRSFGASLGTVPDYAGPPGGKPGVLLAGVRPGSAAEKAGLARGDVLVAIGDHEIRNIEDFMFVLRKSKPGDKTTVTVEREGKRVTLEVTFGASARQ